MQILLFATIPFVVALGLHLVWWRISLPSNHTMALLCLFIGVFAVTSIAVFPWISFIQLLRAALLYVAASFSYIITYSGFEGDSPTLGFMRAVDASGGKGLSDAEVSAFLARRPFLRARLTALLRSGLVREENGYYFASGHRAFGFHLVLGFRKLYGPISRGG
jgi:hypothetical protein